MVVRVTLTQERELKGFCRQRGWKTVAYYADKLSGAKASRPELDRLMQAIRAGKVERLVCYKLDRLLIMSKLFRDMYVTPSTTTVCDAGPNRMELVKPGLPGGPTGKTIFHGTLICAG